MNESETEMTITLLNVTNEYHTPMPEVFFEDYMRKGKYFSCGVRCLKDCFENLRQNQGGSWKVFIPHKEIIRGNEQENILMCLELLEYKIIKYFTVTPKGIEFEFDVLFLYGPIK